MSAFFHGLSQSRNGETTKTPLARTSGVPETAKWVHHMCSPIRWRGTPVHLITSSSLAAASSREAGEDGRQSTAKEGRRRTHLFCVMSTAQDKFTNRGKLSPEKLGTLVEIAKSVRSSSRPLTDCQLLLFILFGTLPKCEPNHDDHEACPIWHHVKASPARLTALQDMQSKAKPEAKPSRMSLPDYCYYVYRNMRNFISDELKWPYFKLGRFRQGVNYYPRDLFRNAQNVRTFDFQDYCRNAGYESQDFPKIVSLAAANKEIVVSYNDKLSSRCVTGGNVLLKAEFEKLDQEIQSAWEKAQWESKRDEAQKAKDREQAKVDAILEAVRSSKWRTMVNIAESCFKRRITREKTRSELMLYSDQSRSVADGIIELLEEKGLSWWSENPPAIAA